MRPEGDKERASRRCGSHATRHTAVTGGAQPAGICQADRTQRGTHWGRTHLRRGRGRGGESALGVGQLLPVTCPGEGCRGRTSREEMGFQWVESSEGDRARRRSAMRRVRTWISQERRETPASTHRLRECKRHAAACQEGQADRGGQARTNLRLALLRLPAAEGVRVLEVLAGCIIAAGQHGDDGEVALEQATVGPGRDVADRRVCARRRAEGGGVAMMTHSLTPPINPLPAHALSHARMHAYARTDTRGHADTPTPAPGS